MTARDRSFARRAGRASPAISMIGERGKDATLLAEALAVAVLYAGFTFFLLQPLLADPSGSLFDPRSALVGDHGVIALKDVLFLTWLYAWGWHALWTNPLRLYDGNAFHPYPQNLAFSEHAIGKVLTAGVAYGVSGNAVLAHQVDLVLSFSLSGAALYVFLRDVEVGRGAAFLAGAVFAFCPARLNTIYHSQLLGFQYLPLALLCLHRTLRSGSRVGAVAFGLLLFVQCACSYYLAYMSLIGLAAYVAVFLLVAWPTVSARGSTFVATSGAVALGLLALLSWPYLEARAVGIVPRYGSANPLARVFLGLASNHPWRSYLLDTPTPKMGIGSFLGWSPLALALVGCLAGLRLQDPARRGRILGCLAVVAVAWAVSLGQGWSVAGVPIPSVYEMLAAAVPGFSSIRAPARFALLLMFGFAGLVGFGIAFASTVLSRWGAPRSVRVGCGLLLLGLVGVEYGWASRTFPAYPYRPGARDPELYAAVSQLPPGAIVEIPFHGKWGIDAALAMVDSTLHWHPLVNGKSGYEPSSRRYVMQVIAGLPKNAEMLTALVRLTGVKYVVVHPEAGEREAWLALPGIRWRRAPPNGSLLGEVVLEQDADLVPFLLACAGYPEWTDTAGPRKKACRRLRVELAAMWRRGGRPARRGAGVRHPTNQRKASRRVRWGRRSTAKVYGVATSSPASRAEPRAPSAPVDAPGTPGLLRGRPIAP
jgi:hypothetical protein